MFVYTWSILGFRKVCWTSGDPKVLAGCRCQVFFCCKCQHVEANLDETAVDEKDFALIWKKHWRDGSLESELDLHTPLFRWHISRSQHKNALKLFDPFLAAGSGSVSGHDHLIFWINTYLTRVVVDFPLLDGYGTHQTNTGFTTHRLWWVFWRTSQDANGFQVEIVSTHRWVDLPERKNALQTSSLYRFI